MPKTIYREKKDKKTGAIVRKEIKADTIVFYDPRGDEWMVSFSIGDGVTINLNRKSTSGPIYVIPRSPTEVKVK